MLNLDITFAALLRVKVRGIYPRKQFLFFPEEDILKSKRTKLTRSLRSLVLSLFFKHF